MLDNWDPELMVHVDNLVENKMIEMEERLTKKLDDLSKLIEDNFKDLIEVLKSK